MATLAYKYMSTGSDGVSLSLDSSFLMRSSSLQNCESTHTPGHVCARTCIQHAFTKGFYPVLVRVLAVVLGDLVQNVVAVQIL